MSPAQPLRVVTARSQWHWPALAGFFAATMATAVLGGIGSVTAGSFYAALVKPAWAPPGWLFAPVWTALYLMMTVAAWLAWRAGGGRERAGNAALLYVAQLVLNAAWTWLFFRWQQGAAALVEIIVLWLLLLATIVQCWRLSTAAGVLLLPYLLWVSFATALTAATWHLNPGIL